jgi:CheY-like chemotaxis protein
MKRIVSVKVLTVDDVQFSNLMISKLLGQEGHEVEMASSVKDALTILHESPDFDCVITDLFLTDLDGFSFFQTAQAMPQYHGEERIELPQFVLMTASRDPEDLQKADRLGFSYMMNKPIHQKHLLTIMQSIEEERASFSKTNQKSKLLIIDPNKIFMTPMQSVLDSCGYTLLYADCLESAVQYLTEFKSIKAILCDLEIHHQNAIQLLNILKSLEEKGKLAQEIPPMMVITNSQDMELVQLAYVSGFSQVIAAPVMESAKLKKHFYRLFMEVQKEDEALVSKLMVVDDVKFNTVMVEQLLSRSKLFCDIPISIMSAYRGEEALEKLKQDISIRWVIVDYDLQDMTALDLYHAYHHFLSKNSSLNAHPAKFFLLTGAQDPKLLKKLKAAPFLEVFQKPFSLNAVDTMYPYIIEEESPHYEYHTV